ncbi:MAG: 4Fe-4S binding protein, partial [Methylocystis sp.]|nr:4Fe-4S binding protein [Methylocystis sp.]
MTIASQSPFRVEAPPAPLDEARLRELALRAGAADVGFVDIDDPALDDQRADILSAFPFARSLISFVVRMNKENIRSPARSVANVEFHRAGDEADEIAHRIASALEGCGIRAAYPAMAFPMEASKWPGKMWVIAHKPVAIAAGLGRMGLHRNVIHPQFGNFILLATVAIDLELTRYSQPIDFNPCMECKLCVAACPTGAIAPDGHFDFSACYTHNYREFMGGFSDWVETIADAKDSRRYRQKVSDAETISWWQSLAYGPNYKAAYCLAVCPAGADVIGPYRADQKNFRAEIVKPFRQKEETIYVTPGSDAEDYVAKRFPHKRLKRIGNGLRPASVTGFLASIRFLFQCERAGGLNAIYHFVFTGAQQRRATVTIANKSLRVEDGLIGKADLSLT